MMTLELAKSRRLEALNSRRGDRVLVKPGHHSQVNMPKEGTVADYLLESLRHGCQSEQIEAETGWSRSIVMSNLYKVAKRTGMGIRRSETTLHLIVPEGADEAFPEPKVVKMDDQTKDEEDFVVIEGTLVA